MKIWQWLLCKLGIHRYVPAYMVYTVRNAKRKYLYREFQFECRCCGKPTKPMRLRRLQEFMDTHNVSWSR